MVDENIGKNFGRLTVLDVADQESLIAGKRHYFCHCACGRQTTVRKSSLLSLNTSSCGCIKHPMGPSKIKGRQCIPLRHRLQEVYDVENSYQKNEELKKAYKDFWATLPEETAKALDACLK